MCRSCLIKNRSCQPAVLNHHALYLFTVIGLMNKEERYAGLVELADTSDSSSDAVRRKVSSTLSRTNSYGLLTIVCMSVNRKC